MRYLMRIGAVIGLMLGIAGVANAELITSTPQAPDIVTQNVGAGDGFIPNDAATTDRGSTTFEINNHAAIDYGAQPAHVANGGTFAAAVPIVLDAGYALNIDNAVIDYGATFYDSSGVLAQRAMAIDDEVTDNGWNANDGNNLAVNNALNVEPGNIVHAVLDATFQNPGGLTMAANNSVMRNLPLRC